MSKDSYDFNTTNKFTDITAIIRYQLKVLKKFRLNQMHLLLLKLCMNKAAKGTKNLGKNSI